MLAHSWMETIVIAVASWLAWSVLLAVVMVVRFLFIGKSARRIFEQQKLLQEETTITWSETGWRTATEHSVTDLPWGYFVKILENEHVILLYQSDLLFNFIPKSVLTPAQATDIVRLAQSGHADA